MKLTTRHYVGIFLGIALAAVNIAFFSAAPIFPFLFGIAALVAGLPFLASYLIEAGREKEKEEMFLEFTRALVENVRAGTPLSKSIVILRDKDFGPLTPHTRKLANQITLGIPVRDAFAIFSRDIKNKVIDRAVALLTQAEESGGEIGSVLESVAKSVRETEDLRKERASGMFNFIVQGYIIFVIFIVIMLVTRIKFIPLLLKTVTVAGAAAFAFGPTPAAAVGVETLNTIFLVLMLIQGLFAGLVIGKLSEGKIAAGIKHSAIFVALAYLITKGAEALFGA